MWFVGSEKPCIYSVPNRKQSYGVYSHNSVEAKAVLEIYNEKFMNVDVSASKKLACKSYSFFVECYEYGLITKEELVEYITNFKEEPENE